MQVPVPSLDGAELPPPYEIPAPAPDRTETPRSKLPLAIPVPSFNGAELPPPQMLPSLNIADVSPLDEVPAPVPAPVRAMTVRDFAQGFRPAPGDYEVDLIHPYTRRPVRVRFSLPHARLEEVNVDFDELEFEYDDYEVEIEFERNGRVEVRYDD